jgi:ADP-ribose pyrophosphatase YjhB (NUDIX family)
VYYFNPSSATVAFIVDDKNELLVCRRAKDPAQGTLDLPGGFIDTRETAEAGVVREVFEETGLIVNESIYQFSLPNIYVYSGFPVHTLDMFFLCKVEDLSCIKPMDDVAACFFLPLDKINSEEFGLDSIRQGIGRLLKENIYESNRLTINNLKI